MTNDENKLVEEGRKAKEELKALKEEASKKAKAEKEVLEANEKAAAKKKKEDEAAAKAEANKKVKYNLCVRYKGIDDEGDNVKISLKSEGTSLEELLANLKYPKGLFNLVKASVQKDGKEVCDEIAIAPLVAQDIFERKNVVVFKKKFGL